MRRGESNNQPKHHGGLPCLLLLLLLLVLWGCGCELSGSSVGCSCWYYNNQPENQYVESSTLSYIIKILFKEHSYSTFYVELSTSQLSSQNYFLHALVREFGKAHDLIGSDFSKFANTYSLKLVFTYCQNSHRQRQTSRKKQSDHVSYLTTG